MERFYEWINTQDESKGFTTITCTHPVGVRGIRLSELRSKDSLICAAPEIVPTAREVTAQKGNNAFLPCYNTAEPIAETSWFFNAEKVVHSPKVSDHKQNLFENFLSEYLLNTAENIIF